MSKELRALLEQLDNMKTEVRSLIGQDKVEEAEKRMNDVRALQKKIDVQRALEEAETDSYGNGGSQSADNNGAGSLESREDKELETEYTSIFLRGIRRRPISEEQRSVIQEYERRTVLNEGETNPVIPDGDLSILVPKDVNTRINQVVRSLDDLSQYVYIEQVTALSGSRVIEAYSTMTPFVELNEYDEMKEMDGPKFRPLDYKLKDRGGFLPITNNLLEDTDQNLLNYITRWIGRKAVVTRNTMITNLLKTLTTTDLQNFDDVKKVLNISLDPAISQMASILTNQDGFNWMDQQKDSTGRYLLTDDITNPGRKLFKGRPVIVAANRYLPSDATAGTAPLIIGDLKEAVTLFSRNFYELASTTEGGDAWRRRTTELRAVIRDDIKLWDEEAVVYGQVDISETV